MGSSYPLFVALVSAPAVVVAQQNRLIRRFAEAAATGPATARVPQDIRCRRGWVFRRMVSVGVFVPTGDGRFYMDQATAEGFRRRRRTTHLIVVAVLLLLLLFASLAILH